SADEESLQTLMDKYSHLTQEYDRINGYAWESEVKGILTGLGFSENDYDRSFNTLSGGQKTRVTLGRLLLEKPELLILDEPTNHLDIESVSWLENYLKNYPGAVLVVSHDRYFLDRLVTKIYDLENGKLTTYLGSYTQYAEKKELLRHAAMAAYLNQQREIRHQEEVITRLKSFNREKSIRRAESREKKLEKIERIDKPTQVKDSMFFTLEPNVTSGNDVLMVEGLAKSYDGKVLFSDVNFLIRRGDHIAVIRANGTGKTNLMKIINGIVEPDSGSVRLGSRVEVGYYDQEQQGLTETLSVFDEIREAYPDLNDTKIRKTLAAFLFTGDDVFKLVSDLSGGERGRLSLAKLILSPCNFLILDEPTNHLDMASKEILEDALSRYTGTILTVSHDRYFINRTADRIFELAGTHIVEYHGNYDYYVEKKSQSGGITVGGKTGVITSGKAMLPPSSSSNPARDQASASTDHAGVGSPQPDSPDGASMWRQQKEEQAKERKRSNEIKKIEDIISSIEERNAQIDELLTHEDVFTDVARLMELTKEREEGQARIDELFEKLEAIENS
ncbi:MAG: ABC-F family ATP-binding cassette domain-containing protein, partial [Lachnospiraceae bacterium]|nr:ABC-F family ATP-binding cassette domain-containing protein [Lachnospiraceae bacterium]